MVLKEMVLSMGKRRQGLDQLLAGVELEPAKPY